MRVLVAQLGARRHYAVPRALSEVGSLELLFTDASRHTFPWRQIALLVDADNLPRFLSSSLRRRIDDVPADRIRGFWLYAVSGRLWDRLRPRESKVDFWVRRNRRFAQLVCSRSWQATDTVYAFNGAALEIFQLARRRGLRCLLDQTAAPWRYNTMLLRKEIERWPDWENSPADLDRSGAMIEREEAEWELADTIICGSDFVVEQVGAVGGPAEKCRVVRYPTPALRMSCKPHRKGNAELPIRVLFVGTLQLRKGIQYFYEAARQLGGKRFQFRAVGESALTVSAHQKLSGVAEVTGRVSRPEVAKHLDWADLFVLPTLSEGSANVCHEAIAAGLPVLTTRAAGIEVSSGPVRLMDADSLAAELPSMEPCANSTWSVENRRLSEYGKELVELDATAVSSA